MANPLQFSKEAREIASVSLAIAASEYPRFTAAEYCCVFSPPRHRASAFLLAELAYETAFYAACDSWLNFADCAHEVYAEAEALLRTGWTP